MNRIGTRAMVLAAGLGQRMRPLTNTRPKPLIEVAGKPLIAHTFDTLAAGQVMHAVVNVHYLADQVESWLAAHAPIPVTISDERDGLLDTAGGIANALEFLGDAPFFAVNCDSFWREGASSALDRMRAHWDTARMDCLLLLSRLECAAGYAGAGDFTLGDDGRLSRGRGRHDGAPAHAHTGCYLVAPEVFAGVPEGPLSMNRLWDRAMAAGRLFGLVHDGLWLHVGTPGAIGQAERALAEWSRRP